jgi:phosphoribosylanthranilate isomerase
MRWSENNFHRTENQALNFMTWVKICGITNLDDALIAVEAGADALGFVFYEKSPRNVAPETVSQIVRQIPEHIEKIGVFVGNNPDNAPELWLSMGLTGSQLHIGPGPVTETTLRALSDFPAGFKTYPSMPAQPLIDSEERASNFVSNLARLAKIVRSYPGGVGPLNFCDRMFLDSGTLLQPGGSGMAFDWLKAAPIVDRLQQVGRVVVAGGLNPTNVTEAIHILKPWGVDVSSGVESKPGKKDPEKVRAFVAAVRQAEKVA